MAGRDLVIILAVITVVAITFFVINFIGNTAVDAIVKNSPINQSAAATAAFNAGETKIINRMDYIVFGTFMAFVLTLLITSYFIGAQPVFIVFYLVIVVLMVAISPLISNVWETATTTGKLATTITNFPLTNHLLLNLPAYMSIVGLMGLFAMFAKPEGRG